MKFHWTCKTGSLFCVFIQLHFFIFCVLFKSFTGKLRRRSTAAQRSRIAALHRRIQFTGGCVGPSAYWGPYSPGGAAGYPGGVRSPMAERIQQAAAMYGAWPAAAGVGSLAGAMSPMLSVAAAAHAHAVGLRGFNPTAAAATAAAIAGYAASPYGALPPLQAPSATTPLTPSAVQPLPSALHHPHPLGLPPSTPTKTAASPRSDSSSKSPVSPTSTTHSGENTHSSFSMDRILGSSNSAKVSSTMTHEGDTPAAATRRASISPSGSEPRSPRNLRDQSPESSPTNPGSASALSFPVPLRPSAAHPLAGGGLHRPLDARSVMDPSSSAQGLRLAALTAAVPPGGLLGSPPCPPSPAAAEAALYAQAAARYTALRDLHLNPHHRTLHRTATETRWSTSESYALFTLRENEHETDIFYNRY